MTTRDGLLTANNPSSPIICMAIAHISDPNSVAVRFAIAQSEREFGC